MMSNVASTTTTPIDQLNIATKSPVKKKSNELGQDAFLELMITQMKNQDPLSPQSNSEFVAQLAQFSSVQGIEKLNSNFNSFSSGFQSNKALQASSLVGTSVSVESKTSILPDHGIISGSVNLPSSTADLKINIYKSNGALAAQIPVGAAGQGDTNFRFDGHQMEVNGELLDWTPGATPLPPDTYTFAVFATQNSKQEQLTTNLSANVNSVTVGADGNLVLNLAGVGSVDISKVKQFN